MTMSQQGFQEHEHTADWELEVWAPDLASLLEQAARGMYALSGTRLQPGKRLTRQIEISAQDAETLLVGFLQELLYLGEMENLAFDGYQLRLAGTHLDATLQGGYIASQDKEIKAVTFHNLNIEVAPQGLNTRIVFDV